jgi:signal transduction histidine kinase
MKFPKLRLSSARLAALYVVIFAVGTAVLLSTVYGLTARVLDREVDAVIQAELSGLLDDYSQGGLLSLIATLHSRTDSWSRSGALYLLIDQYGRPMAGNLATWPTSAAAPEGWIEFDIDAREHGGVGAHPIRARIYDLPGGRRLLVGTDILDRQRLASRVLGAMWWGIALSVALAILISTGYSQRVRKRIGAIAGTCETIMAGDQARRLTVDGSHDEFDELSTTVNRMLDRIQEQTSILQTSFDSAAHDLRAPLYRARVRIEEALQHAETSGTARETMEATLQELDRVQRTLGTLLQIAQAQGRGSAAAVDEVDLAALAHELAELYQPEAASRRIQLEISGEQRVRLVGNRQLLAQALVNLIENALKYVPAGGRVDVRVESTGDAVTLSVADNGPGIPEDERERVLQPFVRLERDRHASGSGLGLSLVAAVVRLHRGSIELLDHQPGLLVQCHLPVQKK